MATVYLCTVCWICVQRRPCAVYWICVLDLCTVYCAVLDLCT
eukprot:COSAG01_NODE_64258_length_277_cov_0.617978_1_plen_41_part_01